MEILVVDDKKSDRDLLSILFTPNGFKVVTASNGREALDYLKVSKPDLIISDILMPEIDGFTLLRELKKSEETSNIPFVFYTAHYLCEEDEKLALKLGASRFIIKPIEPKKLLDEIKKVMKEYKKGLIKPIEPLVKKEDEYLKQYNRILVRKIEEDFKELEDTKNFLEIVLNNIDNGVIVTDLNFKVTFCNKKMHEIMFCDKLAGKLLPEEFHTPCIKDMVRPHQKVCEVTTLNREGKETHLEEIISPIINEENELISYIGVFHDITKLKQDKKLLREREELYHKLFEHANDAIYLIDPLTRNILDCNKKASLMTGYTTQELKKMKTDDLHPEHEIPELPEKFKKISEKGSMTGITGVHHKRKDGTLLPIEVNATMVEVSGKTLNLSIIRDISKHKQAEEEIQKLNNELEEKIRKRTTELEEKNQELERMNKLFVGRELRMIELKETITKLEKEIKTLKTRK